MTQPSCSAVIALELALLDPARRADRAFLEQVLHPDFAEFGSSGRHWRREELIEAMLADPRVDRTEVSELAAQPLAADAILLTYRMPGRLRSSVWLRQDGRWRLRFHQGTPTDSRSAG